MSEERTPLERLQDRKRELEEFLGLPAYRLWDEALQNVIRSHRNAEFGTEISSLDAAFKLANIRGMVSGLQLARGWAQLMLDDVVTDLQTLLEQEREKGNENA